jgi:hypothetical protein
MSVFGNGRLPFYTSNQEGSTIMRTKVSENGITIPKELLEGITEVDIHKHNGIIVVMPVGAEDPIHNIGKNPVNLGISDASENLDKYIYTGE